MEFVVGINKIEQEIKEKETELAKLVEDKRNFEKVGPVLQIAHMMHDLFCHSNHTDMCGWLYGDNKNSTTSEYYKLAERFIQALDTEILKDRVLQISSALLIARKTR